MQCSEASGRGENIKRGPRYIDPESAIGEARRATSIYRKPNKPLTTIK